MPLKAACLHVGGSSADVNEWGTPAESCLRVLREAVQSLSAIPNPEKHQPTDCLGSLQADKQGAT